MDDYVQTQPENLKVDINKLKDAGLTDEQIELYKEFIGTIGSCEGCMDDILKEENEENPPKTE